MQIVLRMELSKGLFTLRSLLHKAAKFYRHLFGGAPTTQMSVKFDDFAEQVSF